MIESSYRACLLDLLDGCADELRQLGKRWDDLQARKGASFVEQYLSGRASVLLDLDFGAARHWVELSALRNGETTNDSAVPAGVYKDNVADLRNGEDWHYENMLVLNVEVMQFEQRVSCPSNVRLKVVDERIRDAWGAFSIYLSSLDGGHKLIPCLKDRELDVLGWDRLVVSQDIAHQNVKGGTKVVSSVSDQQRDIFRDCGRLSNGGNKHAVITVLLGEDKVETTLRKGGQLRTEIVDVLIGPFDL